MPIAFTCPYCGLHTLVDDEFAGASGPCATCGKQITVPAATSSSVRPVRRESLVRRAPLLIVLAVLGSTVGAAVLIGLAIALLSPAVKMARTAQREQSCRRNLIQIRDALAQYAAVHGTYPAAYLTDHQGKPMHSWRVVLLPYLGHQGLYSDYRMEEPWDSPHNIRLAGQMPDVYGCPADPNGTVLGESNYFVILGKHTLFPGPEGQSVSRIRDDPAQTIMLIEAKGSGISWTEPKDFDIRQLHFALDGATGRTVGGAHPGGAHALMADGTVKLIDEITGEEHLQGMATIDGNELIPWEVLGQ